ncbi:MAG: 50S ribosomal protein L18Ae [Candidatus Nanohaloarchaeota archaeon QJJ-9]|nr:50S ribosomal protein L18Ae [Candidatus Nanohaloarchaeota archaeon QJJ-9]
MRFKATGKAKMGDHTQPFEKEIEAETEKYAREKLYSTIGSKHQINRTKIEIEKLEEA